MTYGKRTLIAVDQLLNTLLGGWPDETLSSRCYRWARDGVRAWPRKLVDGLFFWQREPARAVMREREERLLSWLSLFSMYSLFRITAKIKRI